MSLSGKVVPYAYNNALQTKYEKSQNNSDFTYKPYCRC